jgi:hypothetical protein
MTVGSDSTDESETEDEGGGESGPEQLAENLLKHAKRQVEEYAKSTVEADLALTSALTREQRKMLHEYIDKFELQHNTVGNGMDKRMIVSRFKPLPIMVPVASAALGCPLLPAWMIHSCCGSCLSASIPIGRRSSRSTTRAIGWATSPPS